MLQVWQAEGFLDPVSNRLAPVSNRLAPVSVRIALGSSRIAPYRSVSSPDRLVSHRIASSRTVSLRLAPYRSVSHRIGSSRTVTESSRVGIESSRSSSPPCTSVGILVSNYTCLLSAQFAGKSSLLLANLTPVCAGVLLGLCSTSGPPWCSLWPSIVGGNHVAFAVLPAERNLSTTHLFDKSQNQWSLFLHTSFLQGVYSREL